MLEYEQAEHMSLEAQKFDKECRHFVEHLHAKITQLKMLQWQKKHNFRYDSDSGTWLIQQSQSNIDAWKPDESLFI